MSAGYDDARVLHGIDLQVHAGEVLAVLGRNGAGKTTLLHALFNLGPQVQGRLTVHGQDVTGWPTHRIARLGLALVPQGRGVFADLAVRDNLRLATLAPHTRSTSAAAGRAWTLERVFETFPRLAERQRAASGSLSGGERQMLAMARALLTQPQVLVLDEPSEGLAPLAVQEVIARHVADLARDGLTVLLVEQNVPLALQLASRVAVLSAGGLAFEGTPEALARDKALQREHLGV